MSFEDRPPPRIYCVLRLVPFYIEIIASKSWHGIYLLRLWHTNYIGRRLFFHEGTSVMSDPYVSCIYISVISLFFSYVSDEQKLVFSSGAWRRTDL